MNKPGIPIARKTRIVTVRMSDEEYRAICEVTAEQGFRNVSELARAAMQWMVSASGGPHSTALPLSVAARIEEHELLLRALTLEIRRLRDLAGNGRRETRTHHEPE